MKQPWYADNAHRDYPFVPRAVPLDYAPDSSASSDGIPLVDLPKDAIVDFGAIMEVDSGYVNALHDYVYLHAIVRSGDYLLYHMRVTSHDARDEECVFSRNIFVDEEWAVEWVESASIAGSIYTAPEGCISEPKWRAFMVTGIFDSLLALLPADGSLVFSRGLWRVEPAKVQTLANTYLRSVSLANYPRTVATAPPGCPGDDAEQATELVLGAECLSGDVNFIEGFNTSIRQELQNNVLIFSAGVGAGAGEVCEEIPLDSSETTPDGGAFLTGGPSCDEILMSINGVSARNLIIAGGYGVTVGPSATEANTLVIARDDATLLICSPSESLTSESLSTVDCAARPGESLPTRLHVKLTICDTDTVLPDAVWKSAADGGEDSWIWQATGLDDIVPINGCDSASVEEHVACASLTELLCPASGSWAVCRLMFYNLFGLSSGLISSAGVEVISESPLHVRFTYGDPGPLLLRCCDDTTMYLDFYE